MQNYDEIENLPYEVKSGKITEQEGARLIWEDVYTHPFDYGLHCFTEDQKSDFLLSTLKAFETLFQKFIPEQGSFRTFISGCLSNYRNAFLRHQLQKETERRSIDSFLRTRTEEETQKYADISAGETNDEPPVFQAKARNFEDIIHQRADSIDKKKKKVAELTAIVLTMKACKDVDDATMEAVSDFTQLDKSLLYEKVQNLKQGLVKKNETYKTMLRRRNNAFYFHRKYMQEMLSPATTEKQLEILRKKYDGQTKRWEEKNKSLAVHSDTPSNEEIAKSIGIKPRMVSFYINRAKNGHNQERIRQLYQSQKKINQEENEEKDDAKVAEEYENH